MDPMGIAGKWNFIPSKEQWSTGAVLSAILHHRSWIRTKPLEEDIPNLGTVTVLGKPSQF